MYHKYFDIDNEPYNEPDYCYYYAINILGKKRNKYLEKCIAKDSNYSFNYSILVIKGNTRFIEGEKSISKSAEHSYLYASKTKRRFELGETAILKSKFYRELYFSLLDKLK